MGRPTANSYRLVIEAQNSHVPEIVRLRRALKYMLRDCGFKCLSVVDVKAPEQGAELVVDKVAGPEDPRLGEGTPRVSSSVPRLGNHPL